MINQRLLSNEEADTMTLWYSETFRKSYAIKKSVFEDQDQSGALKDIKIPLRSIEDRAWRMYLKKRSFLEGKYFLAFQAIKKFGKSHAYDGKHWHEFCVEEIEGKDAMGSNVLSSKPDRIVNQEHGERWMRASKRFDSINQRAILFNEVFRSILHKFVWACPPSEDYHTLHLSINGRSYWFIGKLNRHGVGEWENVIHPAMQSKTIVM